MIIIIKEHRPNLMISARFQVSMSRDDYILSGIDFSDILTQPCDVVCLPRGFTYSVPFVNRSLTTSKDKPRIRLVKKKRTAEELEASTQQDQASLKLEAIQSVRCSARCPPYKNAIGDVVSSCPFQGVINLYPGIAPCRVRNSCR